MNASNRSGEENDEVRQLPGPVVLIGAGKMGGALLDGWLNFGIDPARIIVIEPQPTAAISGLVARGVRLNPSGPELPAAAGVVIAVKPQAAAEALAVAASSIGASTVVVSIMAGRTLSSLAQALEGCALVRAMPNLPAESAAASLSRSRAAQTPNNEN